MEINFLNTKFRQDQLAKELGCSTSSSQRFRHEISMLSSYRIPSNSHERRQKIYKPR